MTWLLPILTLAFILVLFGGAFFVFRPSRGEPAGQVGRKSQARMKRHPILGYYAPVAILAALFVAAVPGIVTAEPIEAQITRLLLASIHPFSCALLVRFWRWPSAVPSNEPKAQR